jgi:hypothetical protein
MYKQVIKCIKCTNKKMPQKGINTNINAIVFVPSTVRMEDGYNLG